MRTPRFGSKRKRASLVSFVVVFSLLVASYLGVLYLSGQVTVQHLPSSVPQYAPVWGKYVPADYLQAAFQNYSASRSVNVNIPPNGVDIELVDPQINVSTSQVGSILSVSLSTPNQTIDVAFLSPSAYSTLSGALFHSTTYNSTVGTAPIFLVGANSNHTFQVGWMGLVSADHSVAFALGSGQAQAGLTAILRSATGGAPSVVSDLQVAQAAYIAGSSRDALAVGLENFPGVVRTGNLTGTFVRLDGSSILVQNVVGFNSTVSATSQLSYTKTTYRSYTNFAVYDHFIDAQANWGLSQLEEAIRLVGGG